MPTNWFALDLQVALSMTSDWLRSTPRFASDIFRAVWL